MIATPKQLKDELVSFCVEVWRSKAKPVSFEEALPKMFDFGYEEDETYEKEPDGAFMPTPDFSCVLFVPFDDTTPLTKEHQEWRKNLDNFIKYHPEVVSSLDSELDTEIDENSLIYMQDFKPLGQMNRDEKVKVLARHRLMVQCFEEPTAPKFTTLRKPEERKLYFLRTNRSQHLVAEKHPFPSHVSFEQFLVQLEKIAEPYRPALWDRRNLEVDIDEASVPQESSEEEDIKVFKRWMTENKLTEAEHSAWSYRLAKFDSSNMSKNELVNDDWRPFETEEHFSQLVGEMNNPSVRPVFMRKLLEEARGLRESMQHVKPHQNFASPRVLQGPSS